MFFLLFSWQHVYFLYCQSSRFKDVLAKPSHNAIVMEFSRFLLIPMFSSENSTLVKIVDTISLIFRFLSISFLLRSLELIAFPPLGYQRLSAINRSQLGIVGLQHPFSRCPRLWILRATVFLISDCSISHTERLLDVRCPNVS